MYLKSLEVHGFKSFANKIKFEFHNGITGIVGPNGSGKSNVSDAVRWVLGEQRARQLRGANMQDVIFAGTQNRKPLSAATVSITLDNSDHELPIDFSEVTVTRRVFRSGESEYMINGTPCRLKDVNELFYDTGIGKDGYSIIGQGQIDKILSGRPEERRELFDEAAGIVKFKRRKSDATKKLENERANLVRITDILSEIEKQLAPLEKQSEKAKIYLKKYSELQNYEVNLFLMETERVTARLEELEAKGKITEDELKETNDAIEAIKAEYERMEQELAALDEQINNTKDEISNTTVNKGKLEGQINLLEEQIRSAKNNDEHFDNRKQALLSEQEEKENQRQQYQKEQDDLKVQVDAIGDKLNGSKDTLRTIQDEIAKCNAGIENDKNEIINLLNDRASMKAKQQRFDTMLEQINIRKAQLNQRLLQKKSDEQEMLSRLADFEAEYEKTLKDIEDKKGLLASMEHKRKEWNEKYREASAELEQKSIAFHKAESKLESLRNLAERYEGYGNSIRKIMEQKDTEKGLIGVVADIISVDKKYEVAIETALGGNIQNIVTTDEETAKRMVEFLKKNRLGRATFLPLTSVTGKPDDKTQKALEETEFGVLGRADELVNTEARFSDIMEYLLCRVIVVDTIDNALKLAKKYKYALRIVTLEGESLNTGGSITGGAFKNNSNLLGRQRELEDIEKQIKNLTKDREELKNRMEDIKTARELLEEDRKAASEKLSKLQIEANTASLNVDNARKQKEESDHLYEGLSLENSEIEVELNEYKLGISKTKEDLKASEQREKEIGEQTRNFQENLEYQMQLEEEQSKLVAALQMEQGGVEQRFGFAKENYERVEQELAKVKQELSEVLEAAKLSAEDVEKKKSDIEEIQKTIAAGDATYRELTERLTQTIEKKEALNRDHKGFFEQREELAKCHSDLDKELVRLNDQKERLTEGLENQTNHIWEEYELTLHAAMKLRDEELNDATALKRFISDTKEEIRDLGSVNVDAIDEYKELFERYTFLHTQHEDLTKAEAQLVDIIDDLDAGMRKQFTEKFAEIQKEFDKVFKELFGGGKGTLELEEDEDILECGIIITAQPPGKKLQNMMQLSGGEKALTAICLLFAIQNLKPSPFCLLDEIEAALDDSNVTRFAKYLDKLTKHTQFIVITHRRGTMTAADRLYGITMQEKGISALVSVNLIEGELEE
ncbi:MAG: chromosome segregation protein SMC [Lachnospiraceae bacterium]|nr:chromosome segregation protein SMC [Lachnospiraceae bacterium]